MSDSLGMAGSSPLTRGALVPALLRRRSAGIIPAYAGSTKSLWMTRKWAEDHPRLRGEHARILTEVGMDTEIIPAYAGSTASLR